MHGSALDTVAYCGVPPVPQEIWGRWNMDPMLIAAMVLIAAAYVIGVQRADARERPGAARQGAFYGGWAVVAICFISPLCALSVALFSARVAQHMILIAVAAPLLAYGRAGIALRALPWPKRLRTEAPHFRLLVTGAAFAAMLWLWHVPGPYDATLRSDLLYWAMHLTLLGAAYLFWDAQFAAMEEGKGLGVVIAGLATTIQMSLLGAILTFAPTALFASHLATTLPWGLSPLDDQQLGGLIMWVPGGIVFLAASLMALASMLGDDREAPGENAR